MARYGRFAARCKSAAFARPLCAVPQTPLLPAAMLNQTLFARAETMLERAPRLALVLLCLCLYLPGFFTVPALDRDEARFAQASRQMVESGDYVNIRVGSEERNKKPVGIHWAQVAVVHGLEAVLVAAELALEAGRPSAEHVLNVLARLKGKGAVVMAPARNFRHESPLYSHVVVAVVHVTEKNR
jgi:hypothetical protein